MGKLCRSVLRGFQFRVGGKVRAVDGQGRDGDVAVHGGVQVLIKVVRAVVGGVSFGKVAAGLDLLEVVAVIGMALACQKDVPAGVGDVDVEGPATVEITVVHDVSVAGIKILLGPGKGLRDR